MLDRAALRRAFRGLRGRLPRRRAGRLAAARAGLAGERAGAPDRRRGGGGRGRAARGRDVERGRDRPGAGRPARAPRRTSTRLGPRPDLPRRQARGRVGGARGGSAARRRGGRGEPLVRVRRARRPLAAGRDVHPDDRQLPARAAARRGGRARPTSSTCATWPRATCSPPSAGGRASATCSAATTSAGSSCSSASAELSGVHHPLMVLRPRPGRRGRRAARLPAWWPARGSSLMAQNWRYSSAKARRELGYRHASLDRTLRDTIDWYRELPADRAARRRRCRWRRRACGWPGGPGCSAA